MILLILFAYFQHLREALLLRFIEIIRELFKKCATFKFSVCYCSFVFLSQQVFFFFCQYQEQNG